MPQLLPPGTTWLDLATLVIAVGALILTVRRDRATAKVGVGMRVAIEGDELRVGVTNTERRPVSVQTVGLSGEKSTTGFEDWDRINHHLSSSGHMILSDPALPQMLEVGGPAYVVKAPLSRVKGILHPRSPAWIWSTDSYGATRWLRVPDDIAARIVATRRKVREQDRTGGFVEVEIDDGDDLAGRSLA